MDEVWKTTDELARTFRQRDDERKVPTEQQWTLQVLKAGEEFGEAAQAVIGVHGTNPRMGTSHSCDDVQAEVADTAITALVTLARMRPNDAADFFPSILADSRADSSLRPGLRGQRPPRSPLGTTATPRQSTATADRDAIAVRAKIAILGRPEGRTDTPRHGGSDAPRSGCGPRTPRRATVTSPNVVHLLATLMELRSSIAPKGDRHRAAKLVAHVGELVAILDRPGGRPPPRR